jgi:hypothetical protein
MKKAVLLILMAGAGCVFAEGEGLWAGRGGGYELGNSILWQDGTTTRRVGNAWISNDGQTLYKVRNYWLETTPKAK